MAANFITVDTTKRLGNQLRRLIDHQREALELMGKIKAVMEAALDTTPNPDDWSLVESQFGLPAGKGETAYNLVTGARTAVNVANVNQMLDWLG